MGRLAFGRKSGDQVRAKGDVRAPLAQALDQFHSIAAQVVAGMIDAATELPLWVPGVDADEAAMLYVKPLFDGLRASFAARRPASA